jgi:hypothetical protein
MPREGSFALASFGKVKKVQETALAVTTGRNSVALKRIFEAVFESPNSRRRWPLIRAAEPGVRELCFCGTGVLLCVLAD